MSRLGEGRMVLVLTGILVLPVLVWTAWGIVASGDGEAVDSMGGDREVVELPAARYESGTSVEEALRQRRSVRSYAAGPLHLAEAAQLLWAAQGVTYEARGFRTAPSAGATYPLETYLIAGQVEGLPAGVYRYLPGEHKLVRTKEGDVRQAVFEAALAQECVRAGDALLVFTGVYARTTQRYGERGVRYVHMEAGHAAQNVYLQAVALDLGTVVVGAFRDEPLRRVLDLPPEEDPLYILPVGRL